MYVESICCDASKLQYKSVSWKVLGEVDAEKGKSAEKVDVDNMVGLSAH